MSGPRHAPSGLQVERCDEVDELEDRDVLVRLRRAILSCRIRDGVSLRAEWSEPLDEPPRAAIVLVHGFGQNHRTWRLSRRSFPASLVRHGYGVLNLDLRGHGLSRSTSSPASRVDDYVDDLAALISDFHEPPFVAGHSLGAAIAVRSACRVPLAGIIHWAGVFTFAQSNFALRTAARATTMIDRVVPPEQGLSLRPFGRALAWIPRLGAHGGSMLGIAGWSPRGMERDLIQERLVEGFDVVGRGVWSEMRGWALGESIDPAREFAAIQTPLLVLTSESDELARPQDARACLRASGAADKELVTFSRRVHGSALGHIDIVMGAQAPRLVWPVVHSWLAARTAPR